MKKRFTPVALAAALLLCAIPVNAAEMASGDCESVECRADFGKECSRRLKVRI